MLAAGVAPHMAWSEGLRWRRRRSVWNRLLCRQAIFLPPELHKEALWRDELWDLFYADPWLCPLGQESWWSWMKGSDAPIESGKGRPCFLWIASTAVFLSWQEKVHGLPCPVLGLQGVLSGAAGLGESRCLEFICQWWLFLGRKLREVLQRRLINFFVTQSKKDLKKYTKFFEDYGLFIREGIVTVAEQEVKVRPGCWGAGWGWRLDFLGVCHLAPWGKVLT